MYLEEGDIVTVTRGKGYEISSLHSSRASYDSAMFDALMRLAEEKGDTPELEHKAAKNQKIETLELSLASIEKAGHKHFMLKEVLEQPKVSNGACIKEEKERKRKRMTMEKMEKGEFCAFVLICNIKKLTFFF